MSALAVNLNNFEEMSTSDYEMVNGGDYLQVAAAFGAVGTVVRSAASVLPLPPQIKAATVVTGWAITGVGGAIALVGGLFD